MKYICIAVICTSVLFITCVPMINNFETARVNNSEFSVGLSPFYRRAGFFNTEILWRPVLDINYKHRIINTLEAGGGLRFYSWYTPMCYLSTKYQFLQSPVDIAFSLEGAYAADDVEFLGIRPILLISNEKTKTMPYRIALGLNYWSKNYLQHQKDNEYYTGFTFNLGLPFRFGENRKFRIMPDIGFYFSLPFQKTSIYDIYSPFGKWGRKTIVTQVGISLAYVGPEK